MRLILEVLRYVLTVSVLNMFCCVRHLPKLTTFSQLLHGHWDSIGIATDVTWICTTVLKVADNLHTADIVTKQNKKQEIVCMFHVWIVALHVYSNAQSCLKSSLCDSNHCQSTHSGTREKHMCWIVKFFNDPCHSLQVESYVYVMLLYVYCHSVSNRCCVLSQFKNGISRNEDHHYNGW